jgi:CubicO group peptidase (beta-lactamase class C family)
MTRTLLVTASLLTLGTTSADAQRGFDPARLARIDSVLQMQVDSQWIAGAVALVMRDGVVAYERAVGWADREARRPMSTDAIFRIASQTKALTSVAIMMLVEEGRLSLGDPVVRWMPTFPRNITIQQLLTHTAGISYGTDGMLGDQYRAVGLGPAAGYGWYFADKDEPACTVLDRLGSLPFTAKPGERFVYGYNTDILGCVVERISGKSLDLFFRERITGPLGMRDTHFFLPREQRERLVVVYRTDSAGHGVRADTGARGQGHYVDGPRKSFSGGAGLVPTARDYATFLQMLLNEGQLERRRFLSPRAVEVMRTNQVGSLYNANGQGFGLGFSTTERLGANGLNSAGSYGWGGAYASSYLVDPSQGLVMVLMLNNIPGSPAIRGRFSTLVYQALSELRR